MKVFSSAMVVLVAAAAFVIAADKPTKKPKEFRATCPVLGEPAEKDALVMFQGKKLYFCCQSCPDIFNVTPRIYLTKVHLQWYQTGEIVQVACPLKGHVLDPDLSVTITVGGEKLKLCCPGCQAKLGKLKGDKKIDAVFKNIARGFTLQSKCPVSGKPIKAGHVVEYRKQKVYFCCPKCPKVFSDGPKKFLSKLPQLKKSPAKKKPKK